MAETQIAPVALDRAAGDLEGQVYRALRARILGGTLGPGQALPSTRGLATALGLARSTIVGAYERLKAEGFAESAVGRATRVAAIAPPLGAHPRQVRPERAAREEPLLPLRPGVPDLASFPRALWGRLLAARARRLGAEDLGYGAPLGLTALREAILAHIAISRGVVAEPDQLFLFPSTRAAIGLIARLALTPGQSAWIEEPAYPSAQRILAEAGATLLPMPCDEAGIRVDTDAVRPHLIYVTPSHQYPTGVTMSLARRLALLEAASRHGALILEDDYDSEFQFDGKPIAALQGIDRAGVVAYLGTLSKVLAPGVRLSYAVVPRSLAERLGTMIQLQGLAVSIHVQSAFLEFLREGHFRAHIRRMTPLYAARMAAFRAAVQAACGDAIMPGPGTGGLQLALWFRDPTCDDRAIAERLRGAGYGPQALSAMHLGAGRPGLLCGIAGLAPDGTGRAARAIAEAMGAVTLV
ncbi:MAG TPA: PLP-dependent aminotransferase family protein [Acidisoma sp.]|uniref:MocR-like pyridoxine biosynthesis transcription factor PdxR n=1 Tax=Acidisoma sp. TaxID=1872115 RepID=UPI002C1263E0|nr:PLP-dependent aminotransferase family protein [Acidisoma sp.]HTI00780.1 PLP-dependent aminotransferase family protein [Acidisoma sp.]